jgi:hypothetical protein
MSLKETIKKEIKQSSLTMQEVSSKMGYGKRYLFVEFQKKRENDFLLKRVRETIKKYE